MIVFYILGIFAGCFLIFLISQERGHKKDQKYFANKKESPTLDEYEKKIS